jgi:hypothetical protein
MSADIAFFRSVSIFSASSGSTGFVRSPRWGGW